MVAGEVDPRLWHQSRQTGNEIHRFEGHLGRSIYNVIAKFADRTFKSKYPMLYSKQSEEN